MGLLYFGLAAEKVLRFFKISVTEPEWLQFGGNIIGALFSYCRCHYPLVFKKLHAWFNSFFFEPKVNSDETKGLIEKGLNAETNGI